MTPCETGFNAVPLNGLIAVASATTATENGQSQDDIFILRRRDKKPQFSLSNILSQRGKYGSRTRACKSEGRVLDASATICDQFIYF